VPVRAVETAGELIAFRVLQALGGVMLLPIGFTLVAQRAGPRPSPFPDSRRASASSAPIATLSIEKTEATATSSGVVSCAAPAWL
jgi:MFS family permease